MKRRILIILGLLACGTIAQVSIAWVFSIWPLKYGMRQEFSPQEVLAQLQATFGEHAYDESSCRGWAFRAFGRSSRFVFAYDDPGKPGYAHFTLQAGWPLLCLSGHRNHAATNQEVMVAAISPPPILPTSRYRFVPLRPIWAPFIINSVLYAALIYLFVFILRSTRRFIRRVHGRCPTCAYPLRGSSICPECGSPISTKPGVA